MNYNHLMIDAFGCENTEDSDFIKNFLLQSVKVTKMNLITQPRIKGQKKVVNPQIFGGSKKLPGITGVAIIETSHISIHTFSDTKKINFDIYSCRHFSNESVLRHFRKNFSPKKLTIKGCQRI